MEGTTGVLQQDPPETAEKLIQQVRKKTRRRFTAEEKICIVIEGMRREIPTTELCRREGISSVIYYSWLKDFMEAGKARLSGDTQREANRGEVKALKRENERLKLVVADQMLEITLFKKSLNE